MDYIKTDVIFYAGAIIIIFGFSWFIYDEIKEDEGIYTEILWEENRSFIVWSIILMVAAIILWRELYVFIIDHLEFIKNRYTQTIKSIQKIING